MLAFVVAGLSMFWFRVPSSSVFVVIFFLYRFCGLSSVLLIFARPDGSPLTCLDWTVRFRCGLRNSSFSLAAFVYYFCSSRAAKYMESASSQHPNAYHEAERRRRILGTLAEGD